MHILTDGLGQGMTHGTLRAMLLLDLITGQVNPWEKSYVPGRVALKAESLKEFSQDNANVGVAYTELLISSEGASADDTAPGTGAVLRRALTKVAVYKTPQSRTHECVVTYPHLGCVVHRNGLETSLDHSCHGSRIDIYGHLVTGPANSGLVLNGQVIN